MTRRFRPLRRPVFSAFAALLVSGGALADGPGSTSAAYLKLPTGARAIGMGQAYVAAGDDVQAIDWNPAGLARMTQRQVSFMHAQWIQGITYDSLEYAQPIGGFISLGGAIDFLNSGNIDKTTFSNLQSALSGGPGSNPIVSSGVFTVSNVVVTASGAVDVSGLHWIGIPNVQAGMNARVLVEKIDTSSAADAIVDLGGLWTPDTMPRLTVGIVGQNLGPALNGKIPPFSFRLGAAYKALENKSLTASMDFYQPVDNFGRISAGAEYWYKNLICVRGGYGFQGKIDLNELGTGGLDGLTLGVGFRYQIVTLDYAFMTMGFLSQSGTHRVSLTVNF